LVIGQLVGAAAALNLGRLNPLRVSPRALSLTVAGWFALVLGGDLLWAWKHLPGAIRERGATSLIQAQHLRDYLLRGDTAGFADREPMHLPYPNPDRLRQILDNPHIRAILPDSVGGAAPESWLTHAAANVIVAWPAFLVVGLALLAVSAMSAWYRPPACEHSPLSGSSHGADSRLNAERP
jgi:hypothetical protein